MNIWAAICVGIIAFAGVTIYQLRQLHATAVRREELRAAESQRISEASERMMEREAEKDAKRHQLSAGVELALAEAERFRARYHVEQAVIAQEVAKSLGGYSAAKQMSESVRQQLGEALARQLDGIQRPENLPPVKVNMDVPSWGPERVKS